MEKYQEGQEVNGSPLTKEQAEALNKVQTVVTEATANMISKDYADKQIEAAKTSLTEKFEATIEELTSKLVHVGTELSHVKNGMYQGAPTVKTLEDQVELAVKGMEKQIESFLKEKPENGVLTIKTPAITTTTNSTDVTALSASMIADNRYVDGLVRKRRDYQYIFDIADRQKVASTEEYLIWDEEGTEDGTIAVVSESGLKPLQQMNVVSNKSQVKKVAGKVVVTTEFDKFKKRLRQYVRTLFNDHLLRGYQNVLTTQLTTAATAYVGTSLDNSIATPTEIHAIGAMCAQLEVLGYVPDTLVINPQDKWAITLSQDSQGQFFIQNVPVTGANGAVRLLNLNVVTSNKMTAGQVMVLEAGLWKIEEMPVEIKLAYGLTTTSATVSGTSVITSAESDVDYNRMRLIGEIFYHSYIPSNHAGSIVKDTLADVMADLETP